MAKKQRALLFRQSTAAACLLALAACHSSDTKPVGQALASVNGSEITVHQVNAELGSSNPAERGAGPDLQKQALEQVIDRELLAEQATKMKLDRDPAVMLAIERNKSQLLAQAYLQSRTGATIQPGKAEVDAYIGQHPELFGQRKLYDMHYLAMPTTSMTSEVSGLVEGAKSIDELAAGLRAHHVAFTESRFYRTSAELPAPLLANIDVVAKRPVFTMRDHDMALLASLTYVKDDPVPGDQAVQQVEQFLSRKKAATAAHDEIARLRSVAKIEYVKGSEPTAPAQPAIAPAVEKTASANSRAAINSGVSGLH